MQILPFFRHFWTLSERLKYLRSGILVLVLQVLPKYKPKLGSAENVVESAVSLDAPDKRDSRGRLVFSDVPDFRPTLRPKDVIQAGSFGG